VEFRQLEAYIKVYELKSFSKAAEEMFISQPSISAYIVSLENELNIQLLHRSNKEFMPTKAGKVFYTEAKEILALRDKSIKKIRVLSDYTVGSIDILASSVPKQFILPEILSAYHKIHSNVSFNVEQSDTQKVVEGVLSGKSEMGFVGSIIESSKCVYEQLLTEKLLLIAPYHERFLSIRQNDIPNLLRNEYFVLRETGSGTRQEYEEYLASVGIKISELKISASFNNTQSIIHAVSCGLGLSIVSEIAAKEYINNKKIMSIQLDVLTPRHFYLVLKRNCTVSATAQSFIKFIKKHKETNFTQDTNIKEQAMAKNENKKQNCQCPKTECENHGKCVYCKQKHEKLGGLPFCQRSQKECLHTKND